MAVKAGVRSTWASGSMGVRLPSQIRAERYSWTLDQYAVNLTQGEGFLSYGEIDYLIQSQDLTPQYNATSLTTVLQYADQWIGYEDPYTIALKLDCLETSDARSGWCLARTPPGIVLARPPYFRAMQWTETG
ncbi:hypothetical protein B0H17DRAFT_1144075 [Mycena rosella]|uniref:Uncharacterized protein n=1 Tax=Mycena rosella TaxID=1033263 RepID=A0AAD7G648_MYCRO|nr:hypothetical protein B0H17DRAFT_1144075 [Mycena rosella]